MPTIAITRTPPTVLTLMSRFFRPLNSSIAVMMTAPAAATSGTQRCSDEWVPIEPDSAPASAAVVASSICASTVPWAGETGASMCGFRVCERASPRTCFLISP